MVIQNILLELVSILGTFYIVQSIQRYIPIDIDEIPKFAQHTLKALAFYRIASSLGLTDLLDQKWIYILFVVFLISPPIYNYITRDTSQESPFQKMPCSLRIVFLSGSQKMGSGKNKRECQDSYCIDEISRQINFMGVYDGHGQCGKEASQATNDYVQTYLERNYSNILRLKSEKQFKNWFQKAFEVSEQKLSDSGIDYSKSGACVVSTLIYKCHCLIATIGSGKAILCRDGECVELASGNTTEDQNEQQRIKKLGGMVRRVKLNETHEVGPKRIWYNEQGPGITSTRALGHFDGKKIGLSCTPDIIYKQLTKQDKFILIGSDGLWNVMTPQEACDFVNNQGQSDDAAEKLVCECKERWSKRYEEDKGHYEVGDDCQIDQGCDDITATISYFTFNDNDDNGPQY